MNSSSVGDTSRMDSVNCRTGRRVRDGAEHALRVLTINTHKGFNAFNRAFVLPELRDAVRSTHADLVFLQEVHGEHEGHARRWSRWPELPQYEFLAESMWPQFAYGRNAVYQEGDHGNALLSKYPIVDHENIDVSLRRVERRGILYCRIRVTPADRDLHAYCVHLGLKEKDRVEQLRRLSEHVRARIPDDAALIIAGDFNDWRERATGILQPLGVREVFLEQMQASARTFPGRLPLLKLDRIYVRGVRIEEADVLNTAPWPHLSDHVPLYSQVSL